MSTWELQDEIEKIVEANVKEVPYEGTQVDKLGLRQAILELVYKLCPELKPKDDDDEYDQDKDEYYVDCGNDGYNGGIDFYS